MILHGTCDLFTLSCTLAYCGRTLPVVLQEPFANVHGIDVALHAELRL